MMPPDFLYRVLDSVRLSLEVQGERGFALSLARRPYEFFNGSWFLDFVSGMEHRTVPFLWDGRPLQTFSVLGLESSGGPRVVVRCDDDGLVIVRDEVAVARLHACEPDGTLSPILVLGERSEGALDRLMRLFDARSHRFARESRRIIVLGGDSIPREPDTGWDSIVLADELWRDLRQEVDTFFGARDAYERLGVPYRRGLLLTGPPGNGKTSVLRILASQREEPFLLMTRRSNTDESDIGEAFDRARSFAPSILCFEDVDTLFDQSVSLSYFLNRLDGLSSLQGVFILATTNHPEKLDAALTERPSRFDRIFHFGNPESEQRRVYLRRRFDGAFDERLVSWTDGFSFAQLKEVWVSAGLRAIREGRPAPTFDDAREAVERLTGQKRLTATGWRDAGPIGFRAASPQPTPVATRRL